MDAIEEHHLMIQKRHMNDDCFNRRMINAMKRPSPGSVYPMLKKMVEEKLITKLEDGKYELTDKGQEIASKFFGRFRPKENNMDRCGLIVEDALSEIESYVSFLEDIKPGKLTPHIEKIDTISERIEKIQKIVEQRLEREIIMTENAIEINNLTKEFGDFRAVDNLSLEVKAGEIFGFLGPNGAGKAQPSECCARLHSQHQVQQWFQAMILLRMLQMFVKT